MRQHPKPLRNRLKVFLLLVNTSPASPPPRLMHKRPMRRIHQPDDAVIDIARQISHKMRTPKPRRELRQLRHRRQLTPNPAGTHGRHINPRIAIPLFTRKRAGKNLRRIKRLVTGQRRNLSTLPAARLEPPAMILALHCLAVEPPSRQRNPAMRTKVPHRKQLASGLPPHHQRNAKQQSLGHLAHAQHIRAQRRIPIAKDQFRRRPGNILNYNQIIHHALEL